MGNFDFVFSFSNGPVGVGPGYGRTALGRAAGQRRTDLVRTLLSAGEPVNELDRDGATALMMAAANGVPETVELLLKEGADTDIRDQNGDTALLLAAMNGRTQAVAVLLRAGADATIGNDLGETPLKIANTYEWPLTAAMIRGSLKGNFQELKVVVDEGIDLRDDDVRLRELEELLGGFLMEPLQDREAGTPKAGEESAPVQDENDENEEGIAPEDLNEAAERGSVSACRQFLEQGVDIDKTNWFEMTALMQAAENGHLEVVTILLKAGAALDAQDDDGATALMLASRQPVRRHMIWAT
jgi:hypothetical protein